MMMMMLMMMLINSDALMFCLCGCLLTIERGPPAAHAIGVIPDRL